MTGGVAWAAVEDPALFRLVGSDAREALDRVVTQSVKSLEPGAGTLSLLLAPKGQFRAMMAVFGADDGLFVLAPPGHGAELAAALGKYLAFSRSRLEPVALGRGVVIVGPKWSVVARACGADSERLWRGGWQATGSDQAGVRWYGRTFLGVPGALALAETDDSLAPVKAAVDAAGGLEISSGVLELARVDAGWPAWGRELTDTVLPPEVGLDEPAISYTKGCYVGQETIARMKAYGHPTRRLVRLDQTGGPRETPDLPLPITLEGEDKRRGEVTSFAAHPARGGIALGLVRREGAEAGRLWRGGDYHFVVATELRD